MCACLPGRSAAIQFVISSVLPSSSTVVPTQQLVIVSASTTAFGGYKDNCNYYTVPHDMHALCNQGMLARCAC